MVRLMAAIVLPLAVPGIITGILWALPGDPASIICPPQICSGTEALAQRFNLDQGAWHFYSTWMGNALSGDLGRSWRVLQGYPVMDMVKEYLPNTVMLILFAMIPVLFGSIAAAAGWMSDRLDPLWSAIGLVPAVILALLFAAYVQITYGAASYDGFPATLRILLGAVVLGVADGTLAGAIVGTRSVFEAEATQRYAQIAILRGETTISNTLPNVLPALVGQFRARVLHILSGAVVVEVVLGINGVGTLLWDGTLLQDFGVVIAAAWMFSILSSVLLVAQASAEVAVAMHVRRSPAVPA